MNKNLILTMGVSVLICLTGCNKVEEGASFGAVLGALAGQAIGNNTESTLIGVGAGAILGGMIGNDQQKHGHYNSDGSYTQRRSQTRTVLNADGTYTTVGTETTESYQEQDGYQGLP
jgi:uncharacterized protein YcfJ